jgi:hypothetical protein
VAPQNAGAQACPRILWSTNLDNIGHDGICGEQAISFLILHAVASEKTAFSGKQSFNSGLPSGIRLNL